MSNNFNNKFKKEAKHKINHFIVATSVRLIGENIDTPGEVFSLRDAIKMSEKLSLDLIEVSPNANPPVCKIADYQKFLYEQKKKEKDNKQAIKEMKEIRFSVNISENDVETKKKQIIKFVAEGHKVKAVMIFKGREMQSTDRGQVLLLKLAESIQDTAKIEALPRLEGKKMFMIICSKK